MAMLCYALGTRVAAVRSRGVSLSSLSDIHPNIFSSAFCRELCVYYN